MYEQIYFGVKIVNLEQKSQLLGCRNCYFQGERLMYHEINARTISAQFYRYKSNIFLFSNRFPNKQSQSFLTQYIVPQFLLPLYFIIKLKQTQININPSNKNTMQSRTFSTNEKSLTGQNIQMIPFTKMKQRVNAIKFRNSSHNVNLRQQITTLPVRESKKKKTIEEETDKYGTNFWPSKPPLARFNSITTKNKRNSVLEKSLNRYDMSDIRARTASLQQRKFRVFKPQTSMSQNKKQQKRRSTVDEPTYQRQLIYLRQLYDHLGAVLSAIQTGTQNLQKAISDYGKYISNKHMSFIDDFLTNKQPKIRKQIRTCRIYEFLSISYLFLEIAQERLQNNESYLVNFIGFCLSNLIYLSRAYILLEKKPDFSEHSFEKEVYDFEIASYGQQLKDIDDVIVRIQHNNDIITMIHKKLGRQNEKFEKCIKMFLKNAERKKHSTCLCAHYIFEYLAMHIHQSELVGVSEFLQVAPTPYLSSSADHEYTLVIEPIGILKNGEKLRPFINQFFIWAAKHFNVVLWTWQMPSEIQDFVAMVQPYISNKLYRYHCQIKNEIFTKDLTRLGRNLQKTLIIDYDTRIFSETPRNGFVCRWKGGKKDRALLVICQIFQQMVSSESSVEDMLVFYAQELNSIKGF